MTKTSQSLELLDSAVFWVDSGVLEPQLGRGGFLARCGLVLLVVVGDERDEISTSSEQWQTLTHK